MARTSTEEDPDEAWVVALAAAVGGAPEAGVGVGDDAAVLDAAGHVVTTDTMVEGVHWDDRLSPADVGFKLVAVNVSDVGAMGGRPQWATLAASVPTPMDRAWLSAFAEGLQAGLRRWGTRLVGGDTTRSPGPRVFSLTVGGLAPRPVLRSGARPGDHVWVTGALGRSAEAFLAPAPGPEAMAWLRRPLPPVALGAALADAGLVHAMLDLSDGLARDLGRLCRASGVGARVDPASLPGGRPLVQAVAFGEDYELCFAAPPAASDAICSLAAMYGVSVSCVGTFTPSPELVLIGHPAWPAPAFDHFPPGPA